MLTPSLFSYLESNWKNQVLTKGELQLRDAMRDQMIGEGMYGCFVQGKRHDTGMPDVYAEAIEELDEIARQIFLDKAKGEELFEDEEGYENPDDYVAEFVTDDDK